MNKKILVITPRFPIPSSGACEQDRLEGIRQLQRLGAEVQVIGKVFDFQNRENISKFSVETGIPIHLVPYRYTQKRSLGQNFWYYLKRLLWLPYWDGAVYEYQDPKIKQKMEEVLKSFQPDIVWFDYTFMLPLYPLARKYGCKIITHSLIFDPKNLLEEDGRTFLHYISYMVKLFTDWRCIRKSDYMFAIAPDEKKMYQKLGAKKIAVLPLRSLYNLLGKNSVVRDREVLNVFFLGSSYSIAHNLQFAKFIIEEVAPEAHKKYPGKFKFFMTGGKLPQDLQEKCKGVVNYVGFVVDLEEFLSDMDIALIPSLSGTGMQQKIFEPISRGFSIVTSKRGLGEYPFECGEEILCAVSKDEFVAGLGQMLDFETRKKLSSQALKKSQELFSREYSDNLVLGAIAEVSKKQKFNPALFWKDKNVFITGADGFIGSHLAEKLNSFGANIEACEIDLLKQNLVDQNYQTPDYIFHLAAMSPSATDNIDDKKLKEDNVRITQNVLEFCKKTKAKMLAVSSSHVYQKSYVEDFAWKEENVVEGKALSVFGLAKQASEQLCLDYANRYNLDILILRISNVYGPGDKSNRFLPTFIRKCLNKDFPLEVFGNKNTRRDFIYVGDVIDGLTQAIDVLGYTNILNIGSGKGVSIANVAEKIKAEFGFDQEKLKFNEELGKAESNILDITRAKKAFSFSTKFSLSEGIKETVDWWKKQDIK